MRRLATGLVSACALGLLATFASAVGCAASGPTDEGPLPVVEDKPSEPGVKLPPKSSSSGDPDPGAGDDDDDNLGGPTDGGSTSKPDGGPAPRPDAGPPPPPPGPNPGDPCSQLDEVKTVACGFCGTKKTVCESVGGALKWAQYSACEGQPADAVCEAGKSELEACGNCGTRVRTCSSSCKWGFGSCTVPPTAVCSPTTLDLTNAGCPEDQVGKYVYRVRSCRNDCSFNPYSSCISPPTTIEVGPTVNTVSSTIAILAGDLGKISSNVCPVTAAIGEGRAYAYTQIHNPLAQDATVIIYNSEAPGGTKFKTLLVAYDGDQAPITADARKQCLKASNSTNATLTGGPAFAALEGIRKVTIKAGATITLYTSADAAGVNGAVRVNVKTDTLTVPASVP